ncbi:LysR family transcriptional regulator [Streptomyces purpurogeneiscleroticus]|uniref:LysR family transcriptional regulator n=1 Tax=Streptomyces purpurogeneiscleroticus TaxID=68259 RepID=UPI001CC059D0|nr:LysR family transcriptional regulator [Streptomyces purpurogeneiscleroticus]MBZ4020073.1 LysR family transcriptional regulator [Streptomyces purpurogeneiscleroticus]
MIDHRLHVLRTLAEHGTVTATAAVLHLTPSAVSQQLRLLGRDLGVKLLRPEGRRVRLTPAALTLLRHADVLQAQWEVAQAELAQQSETPRGTLRLCGVSSALAALAAPALARLRSSHPQVEPRIVEEESAECYRLLLADDADVALVLPGPDAPPVTDARFEQAPLLTDRQDLLVPEGHRLARPEGVELAEAAGESWIVKERNNDTYPLVTAACAAAGFTPHIAHEVKEWYAVSALVAEGFGVCLLPRIVPLPAHAVTRVPLRGEPVSVRRYLSVVRRGSAAHPIVAAGLDALRDAASGAAGDGYQHVPRGVRR